MERDLLAHILDVSRRMAETRDLDPLLDDVMDEAIRLAGAERGYLVLVPPTAAPGEALDFRVQRDQNGQALAHAEDQVSRSILRQVVDSGEPLILQDAIRDPRFGAADSVIILGLRSIMCVPLIVQGDTIGAIYVENRSIQGRFRQKDALPLILLANQAAVAVQNARLFESMQRSHGELQRRVEERTAELSAANALLEREIAERKQVEASLRRERDRVQEYLNIAGVMIVVIATDGSITLVNRRGCEILEYEEAEIVGKNWFDTCIPERIRDEVKAIFASLMTGQADTFPQVEGIVRTQSGQERTIAWRNTVLRDDEGQIAATLSSGEDITERKRAEEALLESEKLLRTIAANYPSYVSIIEKDLAVGFTSGREFARRNLAPEDFVGLPLEDVFGDYAPTIREHYLKAFDGEEVSFELFINGQYQWYQAIPLYDGGEVSKILAVVDNITERKLAEDSIRQLYEQTRRDAETKTTLLREVNHRVKNNLTSIIGLMHTEQRYAAAEDRKAVREVLDRLVQRIHRLAQVHDMLSQSEWGPVPLSELVQRIISAVLDALPHERWVRSEVLPSPVKVSPAQAGSLALVINELVTNTLKYGLDRHTTPEIAVRIDLQAGDRVRLSYRDNGPGYPENVLSLERQGVGLYLIQNLVGHGLYGTVSLANDGGATTTICFEARERSVT